MFVYLNCGLSCLCDSVHVFLNCANLNLFQQGKLYVMPFWKQVCILIISLLFPLPTQSNDLELLLIKK